MVLDRAGRERQTGSAGCAWLRWLRLVRRLKRLRGRRHGPVLRRRRRRSRCSLGKDLDLALQVGHEAHKRAQRVIVARRLLSRMREVFPDSGWSASTQLAIREQHALHHFRLELGRELICDTRTRRRDGREQRRLKHTIQRSVDLSGQPFLVQT